MFTELATAKHPERNIEWVNRCIGGNRTTRLKERWQTDVIGEKPCRLSIKIGIDDLGSFSRGDPDVLASDPFAANYESILSSTRGALGDIPTC
jgi:hypothetical protein